MWLLHGLSDALIDMGIDPDREVRIDMRDDHLFVEKFATALPPLPEDGWWAIDRY